MDKGISSSFCRGASSSLELALGLALGLAYFMLGSVAPLALGTAGSPMKMERHSDAPTSKELHCQYVRQAALVLGHCARDGGQWSWDACLQGQSRSVDMPASRVDKGTLLSAPGSWSKGPFTEGNKDKNQMVMMIMTVTC